MHEVGLQPHSLTLSAAYDMACMETVVSIALCSYFSLNFIPMHLHNNILFLSSHDVCSYHGCMLCKVLVNKIVGDWVAKWYFI